MKNPAWCPLVVLLGIGNVALAQKADAPAAAPAAAAPQVSTVPPAPNTLIDGTAIKLRLAETISSSNAKVGKSVSFEVVDEVDVQGVPVIPKGAQALATSCLSSRRDLQLYFQRPRATADSSASLRNDKQMGATH